MFALGGPELLLVLILPLSGFLAAIYLSVALRNNARRDQDQAGPASHS